MKPPRLSLNEARARGVLGRQGADLPLDLGAPWLVSLQAQALSDAAAPWAQAWTLVAEWAGARFALRVPEAALAPWLEASAGNRFELHELPPELRALALEQLWRHIAAALAPLRRGGARLLAAHAPDDTPHELPGPHRVAAALRSADGAHSFTAEIATDALGLLLAGGALSQRAPMAAEPASATPMACRFEIGRSVLSRAELLALRVGDVVLVAAPSCDRAADGTARLWLATQGQGGLPVRLSGHQVHVLQAWSPRPMNTALESPAPSDEQPLALDSVPVSLSFDLGEIQLPLAELSQLAAGQSFDLGRPLAGAVRVRANGLLVGLGELVEIDGRLGVALTQIGP